MRRRNRTLSWTVGQNRRVSGTRYAQAARCCWGEDDKYHSETEKFQRGTLDLLLADGHLLVVAHLVVGRGLLVLHVLGDEVLQVGLGFRLYRQFTTPA